MVPSLHTPCSGTKDTLKRRVDRNGIEGKRKGGGCGKEGKERKVGLMRGEEMTKRGRIRGGTCRLWM